MILSESYRLRATVFSALYFAQGVPRGFMAVAMISYLTDLAHVSATTAGGLTAVILLPWTLRAVLGPLLDRYSGSSMGRRRPWILLAQFMMVTTLWGLVIAPDLSTNLTVLAGVFFLHNCFAALQDVSTDALAMDVLPASELGRMNGLMSAAKLAGRGLGAAGLSMVLAGSGLKAAVLIQAAVLMGILVLPLLTVERAGDARFPWSPRNTPGRPTVPLSYRAVFTALRRCVVAPWFVVLFAFALLTSIGEELVDVATKPYYTQVLGWSFVQFSQVNGLSAFAQIISCMAGGWAADRFGARATIAAGMLSYGAIVTCLVLSGSVESSAMWASVLLISYPVAGAFGGVAFFAAAMEVSRAESSVTAFAILSSVATLGHVLGDLALGLLIDQAGVGYHVVFVAGGLLMALPTGLLFLRRQTHR